MPVHQTFRAGGDGADTAGEVQITLSALAAVIFQRGHPLESRQADGVTPGINPLSLQLFGHSLNPHAAGQDQYGLRLVDHGAAALQPGRQVVRLADVVRGQGPGEPALLPQAIYQFLRFLLGEVHLLTPMARKNEHLLRQEGQNILSGFELCYQHITSPPLRPPCPL